MLNKSQKFIFFALLGIAVVIAFYQMANGQALYADGIRWFTDLRGGKSFSDDNLFRYSTLLYHLFTTYIANLFDGEVRLKVLFWLFNFCYLFHPIASMAISWNILDKENKHYIFVQIFSHFLIVLPAIMYPCNHAVEVVSYFWPLFFLSIKKDWAKSDIIIFFFAGLLISLSYSQAILLFPILFVAFSICFYKDKNKFHLLKMGLLTLGAGFILYKLFFLLPQKDRARGLEEIIRTAKDRTFKMYFPLIGFIPAFLAIGKWRFPQLKLFKFVAYFISFIFLIATAHFYITNPDLVNTNLTGFRVLVIPFTALLASLTLLLISLKKFPSFNTKQALLLSFITIPSIIYSFEISQRWKEGLNNIIKETVAQKECIYYERKNFEDLFGRYGVIDSFLPTLSIGLNPNPKINSILFPKEIYPFWKMNEFPNLDYCRSTLKWFLPVYINPKNNYMIPIGEYNNKHDIPFLKNKKFARNLKLIRYNHNDKNQLSYNFTAFNHAETKASFSISEKTSSIKVYFVHQQKEEVQIKLTINGRHIKPINVTKKFIEFGRLEKGLYQIEMIGLINAYKFSVLSPVFYN